MLFEFCAVFPFVVCLLQQTRQKTNQTHYTTVQQSRNYLAVRARVCVCVLVWLILLERVQTSFFGKTFVASLYDRSYIHNDTRKVKVSGVFLDKWKIFCFLFYFSKLFCFWFNTKKQQTFQTFLGTQWKAFHFLKIHHQNTTQIKSVARWRGDSVGVYVNVSTITINQPVGQLVHRLFILKINN